MMASLRILIFHGYLLRGTGSNVYNALLATHLARTELLRGVLDFT